MTTHPAPASRTESDEVTGRDVRVRFCPSPTGAPHVGLARTALFNWAFARHHGGTFVFRVEDTDAARDTEESYEQIVDALEWLGLDYDEGPGVGGPYAPYRQSERAEQHHRVARRLLEAGLAYESFSTPEEVEARHRAAGRDGKLGYDNHDRTLSQEEKDAFRAQGRAPVLRLRMPEEDITFTDLVRGEVTFRAGSVPDFVIVRGNGQPLYTLVNPVDDAAMRITHVIRGEDLLSSTPRQIALHRALIEIGEGQRVPAFAHLPLVLGDGATKLSKRDPQSNLFLHRDRGFVREGIINYLALLGWAIGADRDVFSPDELVADFDVRAVNPNPARWDQKKAEAINAEHLRLLDTEEFASRLLPVLQDTAAIPVPTTTCQLTRLAEIAELVQTRVQVLAEAAPLVAPFYVADDELAIAQDARAGLADTAPQVLDAAVAALEPLSDSVGDPLGGAAEWTSDCIEATLRSAIVDGLSVKPKFAFGPLRAAISGQRISPPLFESMEILGKHSSLARLRRLRAELS